MSTSSHPMSPVSGRSTFRATWLRVVAVSTAGWVALLMLQALAAFTDRVRRDLPGQFTEQVQQGLLLYLPWMVFTVVAFFLLSKVHARQPGLRTALRWFGILTIVYYLPEMVYQAVLFQLMRDLPVSESLTLLFSWPAQYWLLDFAFYLFSFAMVYAVIGVRSGLEAQRHRQEAEAENLTLRLELERQRLGALRAQLEPHFLFNALNAISGLVRGNSTSLALSAIQQLSALLRYALTASSRDWVTVDEELTFVADYVTLQSLRYGNRLTYAVSGATPEIREADCPPLLLQPLIENAIRHDLECHEGPTDIRVDLEHSARRMTMQVSNSRRPDAIANPGMGLGLPTTEDRLRLLYGPAASCTTEVVSDRFIVTIEMPMQGHD